MEFEFKVLIELWFEEPAVKPDKEQTVTSYVDLSVYAETWEDAIDYAEEIAIEMYPEADPIEAIECVCEDSDRHVMWRTVKEIESEK